MSKETKCPKPTISGLQLLPYPFSSDVVSGWTLESSLLTAIYTSFLLETRLLKNPQPWKSPWESFVIAELNSLQPP